MSSLNDEAEEYAFSRYITKIFTRFENGLISFEKMQDLLGKLGRWEFMFGNLSVVEQKELLPILKEID